jgi:hypothetical protein
MNLPLTANDPVMVAAPVMVAPAFVAWIRVEPLYLMSTPWLFVQVIIHSLLVSL